MEDYFSSTEFIGLIKNFRYKASMAEKYEMYVLYIECFSAEDNAVAEEFLSD